MECLTIFVIIVVFIVRGVYAQYSTRANAKKTYEDSLRRLKADPNNPDLREQTVGLGRKYSKLTKHSNGRFEFDEVAFMNDINAACARATVGQDGVAKVEVINPIRVTGKSVTEEVARLGQLFLAGVITAEEFERGKSLREYSPHRG